MCENTEYADGVTCQLSYPMTILGVRIDALSPSAAIQQVQAFLGSDRPHMVVTPNPEMLVAAQKDVYFREVLNEAHLSICDGKGIALLTRGNLTRYAGVDMMEDICALAAAEKKRIFLLGTGTRHTLEKAAAALQQEFPTLIIAGMHPGMPITEKPSPHDATRLILHYDAPAQEELIDSIIAAAPDILFVAFGHSKQEKWIYEHVAELPSVRVAMGIGGAIDFFAGTRRRAPRMMQALGLEWLWRLIQQPTRIRRIWRAVVVFPILYFSKHNHT